MYKVDGDCHQWEAIDAEEEQWEDHPKFRCASLPIYVAAWVQHIFRLQHTCISRHMMQIYASLKHPKTKENMKPTHTHTHTRAHETEITIYLWLMFGTRNWSAIVNEMLFVATRMQMKSMLQCLLSENPMRSGLTLPPSTGLGHDNVWQCSFECDDITQQRHNSNTFIKELAGVLLEKGAT